MSQSKPAAEIAIDETLVRALLTAQQPDLAALALAEIDEGWDNRVFRLGDALAVRLPRRAAAVALIEQEQRWLPALAPRLPLPIPSPIRVGCAGTGFPWAWSIVPWFKGRNALADPPADTRATAAALAQFLRALHQPAPPNAPHNPWRGIRLRDRTQWLVRDLQEVGDRVDRDAILTLWQRVLTAPPRSAPPVWIHGDLHPRNLIVHDGQLSAVVDFGDLTAGDPATDLAVAWMLFPAPVRDAFIAAASGDAMPTDPGLRMRARGWALAFGLVYAAHSAGDAAMQHLGDVTLRAVLDDE